MNKSLLTSILLLQFFLGVFSNQLFAQCPTESFPGGSIWADDCTLKNTAPADFNGQSLEYVWIKSSAQGGDCETAISELNSLNVGALYDAFLDNGGFSGSASPVIGSTSWSFVTDGDGDDLSLEISEAAVPTCYSRCARVVGCTRFYGEVATTADETTCQQDICPTEPFSGGSIWANGCTLQNMAPAEYNGQPLEYVWMKSSAQGGNCEAAMSELLPLNVGELYTDFVANGGFDGGANPAIGSTSWSFVTDGDGDDLSLDVPEVTTATCYGRCARVVGCTRFLGEVATTAQPCTVLPVELTQFKGAADGCNVNLSWSTSSEENFSHYELETSNDGRTFELTASIKGSGSVTGENYFFTDKKADLNNYYRLKMVDYDLSYEYSKIIQVKSDCHIAEEIIVFPNPVEADFVNIKVEAKRATEDLVRIFDITGREVFTQSLSLETGINTIRLDVSELPAQIYFIKIGHRAHSGFAKTTKR